MIILINKNNLEHIIRNTIKPTVLLTPNADNYKSQLIDYIKKNRKATFILDTELKSFENSHYQNLEGLKLAYEIRTNPELMFFGHIRLLGFLPVEKLKNSRFGGILKSLDFSHDKTISDTGTQYSRYPYYNWQKEKALDESKWISVVSELEKIFIQEFRKFEHAFRNITIYNFESTKEKLDKKEELEGHLNTFEQIEKSTVIKNEYYKNYQHVKQIFLEYLKEYINLSDDEIKTKFKNLKNEILNLRNALME